MRFIATRAFKGNKICQVPLQDVIKQNFDTEPQKGIRRDFVIKDIAGDRLRNLERTFWSVGRDQLDMSTSGGGIKFREMQKVRN